MTLSEEKASLRHRIRAQRSSLPDKAELDKQLLQRLLAHSWVQNADTVLAYVSIASEPDTYELIRYLLESGRSLALPVCNSAGEMRFFLLHSIDELKLGAYGIPEPSGREAPVLTNHSLCIVPGLAFTKQGERLGQGGGYYDRFLQAHPKLRKMGLTYQCLIQTSLPCEAHDCRVDAVMTESECFSKQMGGI